ncbi:hypothetical protein ACA910_014835 [Epithemia clementina (nom. ined.)]
MNATTTTTTTSRTNGQQQQRDQLLVSSGLYQLTQNKNKTRRNPDDDDDDNDDDNEIWPKLIGGGRSRHAVVAIPWWNGNHNHNNHNHGTRAIVVLGGCTTYQGPSNSVLVLSTEQRIEPVEHPKPDQLREEEDDVQSPSRRRNTTCPAAYDDDDDVDNDHDDAPAVSAQKSCRPLASKNKTWRYGPNLNQRRDELAATACGDYLYAVGGFDGNDILDTVERIPIANLLSLDNDDDNDDNDSDDGGRTTTTTLFSWTTLPWQMSEPREGCAAVAVQQRFLVILGGYNTVTTTTTVEEDHDNNRGNRNSTMALSSVDILDTHKIKIGMAACTTMDLSWSPLRPGPSLTTPRYGCGAVVVVAAAAAVTDQLTAKEQPMVEEIWVLGGERSDRDHLNSIECLTWSTDAIAEDTVDPKNNNNNNDGWSSFFPSWTLLEDVSLISARAQHAVTTIPRGNGKNGKPTILCSPLIVVAGGWDRDLRALTTVEIVDPQRRLVWTWNQGLAVPRTSFGLTTVVVTMAPPPPPSQPPFDAVITSQPTAVDYDSDENRNSCGSLRCGALSSSSSPRLPPLCWLLAMGGFDSREKTDLVECLAPLVSLSWSGLDSAKTTTMMTTHSSNVVQETTAAAPSVLVSFTGTTSASSPRTGGVATSVPPEGSTWSDQFPSQQACRSTPHQQDADLAVGPDRHYHRQIQRLWNTLLFHHLLISSSRPVSRPSSDNLLATTTSLASSSNHDPESGLCPPSSPDST